MSDRPFDLVVFGATGFTGQQAARWLARNAPGGLRWTLAARREHALREVAREVGLEADLIVADSTDAESIDAMVAQTRCVASFAGPFFRYSAPVVEACVRHDTHYVDITGETPWVRDLIQAYHDTAREQGTRIVPMCGFDSVPSDLGAWFTVRALREATGQAARSVQAAFSMRGGGLNGGTLATLLTLGQAYPRRDLADPFLLNPGSTDRERWKEHADPRGPVFDPQRQRWMMPFVMGPMNTRVVRRSAYLYEQDGDAYGPDFHYQEYLDVKGGSRTRARLQTAALGAAFGLSQTRVGRKLFGVVGPSPGEGPSEEAMDKGSFRVHYHGIGEEGGQIRTRMDSPGDAGNRSTVRFACCAALTLLFDAQEIGLEPGRGGVLTPAYALGEPFLNRLRADGVRLEVEA